MAAGTLGLVIAGAAAFSAFEAHVVNVTATINNATTISTTELTFGNVFPEEILHNPVTLSLSTSFLSTANTGATNVDYVIKQKPKCTVIANSTGLLPPYEQVTEDAAGNFICPANYQAMPLLCPYLSKTSTNTSDTSISAFHGPLTGWTNTTSNTYAAVGHLTAASPSTTWDIDLHTPCFSGQCSQDWASYVRTANPAVTDPTAYEASSTLAGVQMGCDLWYELTGVNNGQSTAAPKVGANFSSYSAPTCTTTVLAEGTIQTAIDSAAGGSTVCVPSGTYTGPIEVNKNITLASLSGPSATIINGGVKITSSGVTVKGFTVNAGIVSGETNPVGFYVAGGSNIIVNSNEIIGVSNSYGVVFVTGASYSTVAVTNNKIHNNSTGIYTNPHTGTLAINNNDIHNNIAGIGGVTGATVQYNEFNGALAEEAIGADTTYDGSIISYNNFLNGSKINNYSAPSIIQAPNNFFNVSAATQAPTNVNTTSVAASQFAHN